MLRVVVSDLSIRFSFDHTIPFGEEAGLKGCTTCRLCINNADPDPWPKVEAEYGGTSFCSHLDVFDKDKGRKVALTKALDATFLDKEERTAVWHRYHNRHLTNAQYEETLNGQS